MRPKRHVAVLLTCHNRRNQTVACLRAVDHAFRHDVAATYHAYLTDDASTDGTADAVRSLSTPVTIVAGSGDLFWNRGMVTSWRSAAQTGKRFDGFMLLNDDTLLDEDAVSNLMATSESYANTAIVVGAVRDPNSATITYGGVVRTSRWHPGRTRRLGPSENPQLADAFNANCVYIPAEVFASVGTLDPVFHHSMGDFDYGFRARRLGFTVVVAPNTVGTCAANGVQGTWRDASLPFRRRLKMLNSPKGLPFSEWKEFLRRHGAPLPTLLAAAPYLTVIASSLLAIGRDERQVRRSAP